MNDDSLKKMLGKGMPPTRTSQVAARKCDTSITMSSVLWVSTGAEARGGSGGAFGFEILIGLAVLVGIWWLVAQVDRETKRMIFGLVIAAAVVLTAIQFIVNVLS